MEPTLKDNITAIRDDIEASIAHVMALVTKDEQVPMSILLIANQAQANLYAAGSLLTLAIGVMPDA